MKIIDKTKKPDKVEFIELKAGDCFKVDDDRFDCTDNIFIRTNLGAFKECNAVCLDDGEVEEFPTDTECIIVDTELTVRIKK